MKCRVAIVLALFFLVQAGCETNAVPHPEFQGGSLRPLDTSEPIPFFISDGSTLPGQDVVDGELARMAFDAWERESGGRLRFVESSSGDEALVRLIWVSAASLFGEARRISVDGKPGADVFVTLDVSGLGPTLGRRVSEDPLLRHVIVYLTCVHELGHAIGLPHTEDFEDIMYSFGYGGDIVEYFLRYRRNLDSSRDISDHSGLSDGDRAALRRLYPGTDALER